MTIRILVVEDEFQQRDILKRRLERCGFLVHCAKDGSTGIKMAATKPDLILMDIGLGDMSGLHATRLIKSSPLTANIPIIAVTGHALATDRQQSIMAGCSDFEPKPVDFARLLVKIKRLMAARSEALSCKCA